MKGGRYYMRRIATLLAGAALAGGLSACASHGPKVAVTQPAMPSADQASGHEVTQTTRTTASVSARTSTLGVVQQTQVELQRMSSATHSLATPDGVGVHDAQSELKKVGRRFDSLAHRAQLLPGKDPARLLLIAADQALGNAAGSLQHLVVGRTTQSRILAVSDPIRHLMVDVGRIGRQVTSADRANIHADLEDLSAKMAQVGPTSSG